MRSAGEGERVEFGRAPIAAGGARVVAARPPLKWAGGKGWAVEFLKAILPSAIDTYYEPFVGGGALFFALANERRFRTAVLGDTNRELMAVYRALQDPTALESVIELLRGYRNDRELFLRVRAQDPAKLPLAAVAARMIFLNKTGFNGLYRVNAAGKFNVPFGRYTNPTLCDEANLRAVHAALTFGMIEHDHPLLIADDFAVAVEEAKAGDVVVFDPPYVPTSDTASFVSYTAGKFSMKEHERLLGCFDALATRGVAVVLFNADVARVRELYRGRDVRRLEAKRSINSKGGARGLVGEVLVVANCIG